MPTPNRSKVSTLVQNMNDSMPSTSGNDSQRRPSTKRRPSIRDDGVPFGEESDEDVSQVFNFDPKYLKQLGKVMKPSSKCPADGTDPLVSESDVTFSQQALFDPRFDKYLEPKYAKRARELMTRICEKASINTDFLKNERIDVKTARTFVFYCRLMAPSKPSHFLLRHGSEDFKSERLLAFFEQNFDPRQILHRLSLFNKRLSQDKDRIRVHGQYYNNVYLGKRIFGPARKQVFTHSIVGGMERRFEIIDNQVNHVPFTHEASDKYPEKCRNKRVKCRDDTRIQLTYPENSELPTFIHANRVSTPLLFNDFIITQAPMANTIDDFWRLVWQEGVRYIFMLISRLDPKRCAPYWPAEKGTQLVTCGLTITAIDVDDLRDALFRVTTLRITGPGGKTVTVEHWQGNLNNSANVETPLKLLQMARNCSAPTLVHDHLGISRATVLVACELAICNLLRGPSFNYPVQRAVHYLRSFRAFAVETPMQYIFIHKVVLQFVRPFIGDPEGFRSDYLRWLEERSRRSFVKDSTCLIPVHTLLSPPIDPDLLRLVRRPERPVDRREIHAHVGEMPVPIEDDMKQALTMLPSKYPKGRHY